MSNVHPYLDLQVGLIEQYAKIIPISELAQYQQKGWLDYQTVGLADGDEDAALLYGELDKTKETLVFNRPIALNNMSVDCLENQKITGFSNHLGSYGMGGPGFFGLLLSNQQYLVFAVWGAGSYVLLNQRVVECHPDLYDEHRPWLSNFGGDLTWDELSYALLDATIQDVCLSEHELALTLERDGEVCLMQFCQQNLVLPVGKQGLSAAYDHGEMADYVVLQDEDAVLIV